MRQRSEESRASALPSSSSCRRIKCPRELRSTCFRNALPHFRDTAHKIPLQLSNSMKNSLVSTAENQNINYTNQYHKKIIADLPPQPVFKIKFANTASKRWRLAHRFGGKQKTIDGANTLPSAFAARVSDARQGKNRSPMASPPSTTSSKPGPRPLPRRLPSPCARASRWRPAAQRGLPLCAPHRRST